MKWRRGEGVASVANTRLTGARFRICGNDWSYGRIFGSVANTGLSDILGDGRGRGGRGERYRAAGAPGFSGAGCRQSRARFAGTQQTTFLLFVQLSVTRPDAT